MTELQSELLRQGLFIFGLWLLATLAGIWFTYWLIKRAVRDGINESQLVDSWAKTVARERKPDLGDLPEMRADR